MVNDINNMMTSTFELAVQMSIGQAVLRLVDRMLWVIEKSAQWALPSSEISSGNYRSLRYVCILFIIKKN